jgi:hypothetical protein
MVVLTAVQTAALKDGSLVVHSVELKAGHLVGHLAATKVAQKAGLWAGLWAALKAAK